MKSERLGAIILLVIFQLQGMSIRDLSPEEKSIEQYDNLSLRGEGITNLDGLYEIRDYVRIQGLFLNRNALVTLPARVLFNLTNLAVLDLSENQLEELHEDSLKGLEYLIWLSLNHNNLRTLPPTLFKDQKRLHTLFMACNKINMLPQELLLGLGDLTHVTLNNNQLSSLPDGICNSTPRLSSLNLATNKFSRDQINSIQSRFQGREIQLNFTDQHPDVIVVANILLSEPLHTCPICFGEIEVTAYRTPCGHIFHASCLAGWLTHSASTRCPFCQAVAFDREAP